jgi:uncharacterized protein
MRAVTETFVTWGQVVWQQALSEAGREEGTRVSKSFPAKTRSLRHGSFRPWWFLALTFVWTWSFWWSAVLSGRGWADPLTFGLFALGGAGPLLSAAVLLRVAGRRQAELDFWRRVVDVRVLGVREWGLLAVVALLPSVVGRAASGGDGQTLVPGAVLVLVTAVVAGILEEPGWRGYGLDSLNDRYSAVLAAGIIGVAWALWHLPLFFLPGSYQAGLGLGPDGFWLFVLVLFALSFVYAAVYFVTGRSILAVVVLHAAANAAGELVSTPGERIAETVVTLVMSVVAVAVLVPRARGDRGLDSRGVAPRPER